MTLQFKVTKPVLALLIAIDGAITTFAAAVVKASSPGPLGDAGAACIVAVGAAVGVYLTTEEQTAPAA